MIDYVFLLRNCIFFVGLVDIEGCRMVKVVSLARGIVVCTEIGNRCILGPISRVRTSFFFVYGL